MSRINVVEEFIGSTLRTTWVNSGVAYTSLYSALFDTNSALVSSASQTASGDGHYFSDLALPTSRQWLLNEQRGVLGANTYTRYQLINVRHPLPGA